MLWHPGMYWRVSTRLDAQGGNMVNADYIAGQNTRHAEKTVRQDDDDEVAASPVVAGRRLQLRQPVHLGARSRLRAAEHHCGGEVQRCEHRPEAGRDAAG